MSLIWADTRKFQPVRGTRDTLNDDDMTMLDGIEGEHMDRSIDRKNIFAIWPEFSGLAEDLPEECAGWEDLVEICRLGFDTTRYACGILARTIEWDIQPRYRVMDDAASSNSYSYGSTGLRKANRVPFRIQIAIAADQIWQLLVDDYSPAEKASVSFNIASTMLHELAVSVSLRGRLRSTPRVGPITDKTHVARIM